MRKKQNRPGLWPAIMTLGILILAMSACPPIEDDKFNALWSVDLREAAVCEAIAFGEDILILGFEGGLSCIDSESGERLWRLKLEGRFVEAPVIDSDGAIYVQSGSGSIYKVTVNGQTPQIAWENKEMLRTSEGRPFLGAQTILCVNDLYKEAVFYNKSNGAIRARVSLENEILSSEYGWTSISVFSLGPNGYALFSYATTSIAFINESGEIVAALNLYNNPAEYDEEELYPVDLDPSLVTNYSSILQRGNSLFGVFSQNYDADTADPPNQTEEGDIRVRYFIAELLPTGIGAQTEFLDRSQTESYQSTIMDMGLYAQNLLILRVTGIDPGSSFICFNLDDAQLIYEKNPLNDAGILYGDIDTAYFDDGGKIIFLYENFSQGSFAVFDRFVYIHDPAETDLGKAPFLSIRKINKIATPSIIGGKLIFPSTEGVVRAFELGVGDILLRMGGY